MSHGPSKPFWSCIAFMTPGLRLFSPTYLSNKEKSVNLINIQLRVRCSPLEKPFLKCLLGVLATHWLPAAEDLALHK